MTCASHNKTNVENAKIDSSGSRRNRVNVLLSRKLDFGEGDAFFFLEGNTGASSPRDVSKARAAATEKLEQAAFCFVTVAVPITQTRQDEDSGRCPHNKRLQTRSVETQDFPRFESFIEQPAFEKHIISKTVLTTAGSRQQTSASNRIAIPSISSNFTGKLVRKIFRSAHSFNY